MHLSPEFGKTIYEIEKDEFKIHDKLEILLSSNSKVGMTKATGLAFYLLQIVSQKLIQIF